MEKELRRSRRKSREEQRQRRRSRQPILEPELEVDEGAGSSYVNRIASLSEQFPIGEWSTSFSPRTVYEILMEQR